MGEERQMSRRGKREEMEEELKKQRKGGLVAGWWGYDELKMTLSSSLVSKDHSVC